MLGKRDTQFERLFNEVYMAIMDHYEISCNGKLIYNAKKFCKEYDINYDMLRHYYDFEDPSVLTKIILLLANDNTRNNILSDLNVI